MSSPGALSLRGSNTPITMQALRCFSGLPLFMLNYIVLSALCDMLEEFAYDANSQIFPISRPFINFP